MAPFKFVVKSTLLICHAYDRNEKILDNFLHSEEDVRLKKRKEM